MALPHGDRADVYSWALLAWSVASGRTPFEGIGRSAFYSRVVVGCFVVFVVSGLWSPEIFIHVHTYIYVLFFLSAL